MILIDKIYSTRERWLFAAMQQINIEVFNKSEVKSKYWKTHLGKFPGHSDVDPIGTYPMHQPGV